MKESLLGNAEINKDNLRKACEAYSVLGYEDIRKYYDILYADSLSKQGGKLNNNVFLKYSDIVNHYANEGSIVAERILEDSANEKYSVFTSSLVSQFLIRGLWSGWFMEFKFHMAGIVLFIILIQNFSVTFLILALSMTTIGMIISLSNFRQFTVSDTKRILKAIN